MRPQAIREEVIYPSHVLISLGLLAKPQLKLMTSGSAMRERAVEGWRSIILNEGGTSRHTSKLFGKTTALLVMDLIIEQLLLALPHLLHLPGVRTADSRADGYQGRKLWHSPGNRYPTRNDVGYLSGCCSIRLR